MKLHSIAMKNLVKATIRPLVDRVGLLALSGCGGATPEAGSAATKAAAPGKPRIALVMKSLANEFFATMAEGAKRHQREHAAGYELIVNGIKDERDLNRQVGLVDEMIAQGVDAIVIAPADSKALVSACKRASRRGLSSSTSTTSLTNRSSPISRSRSRSWGRTTAWVLARLATCWRGL